MGGGLSFTYGYFVEFVIAEVGWRNAFIVIATVIVAILLPIYLRFFYYRPQSKPYSSSKTLAVPEAKETAGLAKESLSCDWTFGSALRTY